MLINTDRTQYTLRHSDRSPSTDPGRAQGLAHLRAWLFVLFGLLLLSPARAECQNVAAHWGSFIKKTSVRDCLDFARDALRGRSLQVWENGGYYIRIGGTNTVVVEVACVPTGRPNEVAVTVSAFSADSRTAELARNQVREQIVRSIRFD